MKRFVEGADRGQATLLPECLDEFIDESNPVRAIDVFVDALDLASIRQRRAGRPTILNLTRVMNIVGTKRLIAAITA